jgi:UDP-3-O-[3-hydroxymyristoyl] N-acetylglucosamine deacetylase
VNGHQSTLQINLSPNNFANLVSLVSTSFRTLQNSVSLDGIGLHSGARVRATLQPRDAIGIVFIRTDIAGSPEIAASLHHITRTTHATTLEQDGVTVSTTEHLLAALWALGITNCCVELNGPEVPILDGSAQGWCKLLQEAGNAPSSTLSASKRPIFALREPVAVFAGQSSVLGLPHPEFRLSAAVEYDTAWNSRQETDVVVNAASFVEELSPARTFTLQEWIEPLRAQGLIRGGSPENALILDANGTSAPLRFPDELARHKALDVVGDIALLFAENGGALQAHLVAIKAGHDLHRAWMTECLRRDALIQVV